VIKIVCPDCKSDDVRIWEEGSYKDNVFFKCNTKGCDCNKAYSFTFGRDTIKVENDSNEDFKGKKTKKISG
jgi:hypothetical protein